MPDEGRQKLWNIEEVIKDINEFPQTYDTILGDNKSDGTCQFILRRKLNILCKEGKVCKGVIPGTRFGKVIFYSNPKKYHILIIGTRTGSEVFSFFEYKKISKFYIVVNKYWKLDGGTWIKGYNKRFFDGDVLKWM